MARRRKSPRKPRPSAQAVLAAETRWWEEWAAYLAPPLAVFVVFSFSLKNGYVWDDTQYLLENPFLKLKWPVFVKWAFTSFYAANYHPLTWLSHRLDVAMWSGAPMGHHLTNVIIHAVNTLLVVHLAASLTRIAHRAAARRFCLYAGLFAGLIFGVHPLRVESVAWIAERKDVLCALFFLLTVICHLRFAETKSAMFYRLSLGCALLALLAKPMAVSLPVVLLILDVYPLGRLELRSAFSKGTRVLVEKVPFVLLSAASLLLTLFAQKASGAFVAIKSAPILLRLWVAARGLVFYLVKSLVPAGLAPLYPYPEAAGFEHFLSGALLAALLAFMLLRRKETAWLWAAMAYYVVTLIPVLGLVQVGQQSAADRYSYLPILGPLFLAAAAWARVATWPKPLARRAAVIGLIAVTSLFGLLSVRQIPHWRDSVTLFTREIEVFGDKVSSAYNNRGVGYEKMGRFQEAFADYEKALRLKPDYPDALVNRARLKRLMRDLEGSLKDLERAAALAPTHLKVFNSRGVVLDLMGRHREALHEFQKALSLNPFSHQTQFNVGLHHFQYGDLKKAESHVQRALILAPGFARAHELLARILMKQGRLRHAEESLRRALSLEPRSPMASLTLAEILTRMGRLKGAVQVLDAAISFNPGLKDGYFMRGMLRFRLGDKELADRDLRAAASMGHQGAASFLRRMGR